MPVSSRGLSFVCGWFGVLLLGLGGWRALGFRLCVWCWVCRQWGLIEVYLRSWVTDSFSGAGFVVSVSAIRGCVPGSFVYVCLVWRFARRCLCGFFVGV